MHFSARSYGRVRGGRSVAKEDNKQPYHFIGNAAIIANKCRRNHFLVVTPIYPEDPFPLGWSKSSWALQQLDDSWCFTDYSNFRCDVRTALLFLGGEQQPIVQCTWSSTTSKVPQDNKVPLSYPPHISSSYQSIDIFLFTVHRNHTRLCFEISIDFIKVPRIVQCCCFFVALVGGAIWITKGSYWMAAGERELFATTLERDGGELLLLFIEDLIANKSNDTIEMEQVL